MHQVDQIYINGQFVTPHGEELFDLFNPATAQCIGQVRLADEHDANNAVSAAKQAFPEFSRTTKSVRVDYLKCMHAAVAAIETELTGAIIEEYGAPVSRARWMAKHAASTLLDAAAVLADYDFTRRIGIADVTMQPWVLPGSSPLGTVTPASSAASWPQHWRPVVQQ